MAARRTRAISGLIKNVSADNFFFLCDGRVVKNVRELVYLLDDISDETFYHHVTADRNDFAAWISDVVKDYELGEKVGKEKDRLHMQLAICRHLIKKIR